MSFGRPLCAKSGHAPTSVAAIGKTVQLRTMKVHGQMMIVPMDMAYDVFHVNCTGSTTSK
jgi:hypothetical protein